ncbi:MAG: hypothetical protein M0035_11360 [Actinomycetota bacterium]|nr:hypothetical protein [Actinomycetota bacterium]
MPTGVPVVEARRGSPGEVVELRLEQFFEDLAGLFVHLDVPPPTDPSGALGGVEPSGDRVRSEVEVRLPSTLEIVAAGGTATTGDRWTE